MQRLPNYCCEQQQAASVRQEGFGREALIGAMQERRGDPNRTAVQPPGSRAQGPLGDARQQASPST